MTDRFVTVPDSLELPEDVKVPSARLSDSTAAGRALLDAADAAAQRTALGLGTAATTPATDYATAAQGAKVDAGDVAQITLTGNLALTIPEGHPAGQVYRCAITQTTGGHTVTYDGAPVDVDTAAGAVTTVELHPVGAGYVVRYPVTNLDAQVSALAEDGGSMLGASLSSTYVSLAIAPLPTGVAAIDTAAVQAAIDATPENGTLWFRESSTRYALNASLTFDRNISIEGAGLYATFAGRSESGLLDRPVSPYFKGVVFEQHTAGANIFTMDPAVTAVSLHMRNIAGVWADSIIDTDTGHGLYCATTVPNDTGYDTGLADFTLRNVQFYGVDGDHYGFYLLNPIYGQIDHCRSYQGGGFYIEGHGSTGSVNAIYGNIVASDCYNNLRNVGTANSFELRTPNNTLNLVTFVRPQSNITGAAQASGTQYHWRSLGGGTQPTQIVIVAPDLEGSPNPVDFGGASGGTSIVGNAKLYVVPVDGMSAGFAKPGYQQYSSSSTFTVPNHVTKIRFRIIGAGGGGGGGQVGGVGGGGGGAGAIIEGSMMVVPGETVTVAVGTGGTGGSGSSNGGTGGNSSISATNGTRTAPGGSGGQRGQDGGAGGFVGTRTSTPYLPGAGGPGGASTVNGSLAVPGTTGCVGGGGGGGAGTSTGGTGGSARTGGTGSFPASNAANGGTQGGSGTTSGTNGTTATGPGCGGGGGGAAYTGGTVGSGGGGANGLVELWY